MDRLRFHLCIISQLVQSVRSRVHIYTVNVQWDHALVKSETHVQAEHTPADKQTPPVCSFELLWLYKKLPVTSGIQQSNTGANLCH